MKPVYDELRELRLAQRISLSDIADDTRIRLDFLELIEAGDLSFLPQPYVRAFLREYAAILGVDPNRVTERLDGRSNLPLSDLIENPTDESSASAPVAEITETATNISAALTSSEELPAVAVIEPPADSASEPERFQEPEPATTFVKMHDETVPAPSTTETPAPEVQTVLFAEPKSSPAPAHEKRTRRKKTAATTDSAPIAAIESERLSPHENSIPATESQSMEPVHDEYKHIEFEEPRSFSNVLFAILTLLFLAAAVVVFLLHR